LYRRRKQQSPQQEVKPPAPEATVVEETTTEAHPSHEAPYQLPEEVLESLDEDLVRVIRGVHEGTRRQIEAQQKELQSLRASLSEREIASAEEQERKEFLQFDKDVQELGDEWKGIFGEGDGSALVAAGQTDPVSRVAVEYRLDLIDEVYKVREDAVKKGWVLNRQQELCYALMRQFPDKFQQVVSGNSNSDSGQSRGVTASRPTQRRTPPKNRNEKLLSDVARNLKKKRSDFSLDMGDPTEEFEGEV
jgi:hypothetical protein